jgi:hypothetical protein
MSNVRPAGNQRHYDSNRFRNLATLERKNRMHLSFVPESAGVQMSSTLGTTLSYSLNMKPESEEFSLRSGLSLRECVFNLTIHPQSQSPYQRESEMDGRLGEVRPLMLHPSTQNNTYGIWLHIPDDQFNTLLFEASRRNLPIDIDIGVNDGGADEESDGMTDGVWNDVYPGVGPTGYLPIRSFLFTCHLVKHVSANPTA